MVIRRRAEAHQSAEQPGAHHRLADELLERVAFVTERVEPLETVTHELDAHRARKGESPARVEAPTAAAAATLAAAAAAAALAAAIAAALAQQSGIGRASEGSGVAALGIRLHRRHVAKRSIVHVRRGPARRASSLRDRLEIVSLRDRLEIVSLRGVSHSYT